MACQVWIGGGLLFVSVGCSALSLGVVQGQALIGRPLDVSIPLGLTDGETVGNACVTSQVFFADDAVSGLSVRTAVVGSSSGKTATVRIQTTVPLAETFVRIELQAGCTQRLSRSYVLLADLAPAIPPLAVNVPKPLAASSPPAAISASTEATRNPVANPESTAKLEPSQSAGAATTPRVPRKSDKPASRPPRATSPSRKSDGVQVTAAAGARLKLDPLELVASVNQMQPALRLSVDSSMESVETADLEQRRQAARLLWRALNETPEELAANALKAEASDAESARIKAVLAAAQQAEHAAQAQLLQEREGRYTERLFLGVLAALALAAGGVATLRRRRQAAGDTASKQAIPWLKVDPLPDEPLAAVAPVPKDAWLDKLKAKFARKPHALLVPRDSHDSPQPELDIDVETLMPEDEWHERPQAVAQPHEARPSVAHADFGPSTLVETGRSVATEELLDLQQQVEFFISLGQADQAVDVLKAHLADSDAPSPLAYLDLLKLHHESGHREDYESVRSVFNGKFNGNAPTFDRYSTSRRGLARYETALSRIQALWPQPAVLQLIERSIFRLHPDDQSEVFDLEAYRELLLLYGIAREVIESRSGESTGLAQAAGSHERVSRDESDFGHTVIQPLSATMSPAFTANASNALVAATEASASPAAGMSHSGKPVPGTAEVYDAFGVVGLDLDLSLDSEVSQADAARSTGVLRRTRVDFEAASNGDVPHVTAPTDAHERLPITPSLIDVDFSDLDEPDEITIKQSGRPD